MKTRLTQSLQQTNRGFTLAELLIVTTIIGILTTIALGTGIKEMRRERVNAVTIELAGWLENVRRSALHGTSCTVTINTGDINAGNTLASANANNCLPNSPLIINKNDGGMTFNVSSTDAMITFTPRGTRYPSGSDTIITVTLQPNGPSRCVMIRGLLGMIGLGKSEGGSCTPDQRF